MMSYVGSLLSTSSTTSRWALAVGAIASLCIAGSAALSAASTDAVQLVGTWRLMTYVDTPDGGAPFYAFGREPTGQFIFTADGHFAVNIMRNPPDIGAPTTDPDPDTCIPGWYCSYFGTYSVDSKHRTWVAHVVGGNIPAYLGTYEGRSFTLRGDRLTISVNSAESGKNVHSERVLIRAKAP